MSMVAFFPWVYIERELDLGDFQLIPFRRARLPAALRSDPEPALQSMLDAVLAPFRTYGRPVNGATLLRLGRHELTDELGEDELELAYLAAELVAFSGLAAREYFEPHGLRLSYCNFHGFAFYVQRYSGRPYGAAVSVRRRDGKILSGILGPDYRVDAEPHVDAEQPVLLDEPLLRALLAARERDEWPSLDEAIFWFNRANTDDERVRPQVEAVMMVGAFERVFGLWGGDEKELGRAFAAAFMPSSERSVSDATRLQRTRYHDPVTVREAWIRDFFRVRADPAHGRRDARYPSVWPLREHLLLGAYAFPLLVKLRLRELGLYEPVESDRIDVDLFERLASEDAFAHLFAPKDEDPRPKPAWAVIRDQAERERRRERAVRTFRETEVADEPDGESGPQRV